LNKKIAILISLVLAVVFTLGIMWTANSRYKEAAQTTEVVQATRYIPVGEKISEPDIKTVEVQKDIAAGMITNRDEIIGKAPAVSLVEGQYIFKGSLGDGVSKESGLKEVFIPVDISSSAMVMPGERVDIHLVDRNNREAETAPLLYERARVLHVKDQQGSEITPGSSALKEARSPRGNVPVTVGVEVPGDIAGKLVQYAYNDAVYLVRTN